MRRIKRMFTFKNKFEIEQDSYDFDLALATWNQKCQELRLQLMAAAESNDPIALAVAQTALAEHSANAPRIPSVLKAVM